MSRDLTVRLGGLLALVAGIALLYFFLVMPLAQAQSGEPEVSYSLRAFVAVPFCIVFGLLFIVLGERFEYRTADHKNLTVAGWSAFAVVAVLTGLGWWWFDSQFTALGYL